MIIINISRKLLLFWTPCAYQLSAGRIIGHRANRPNRRATPLPVAGAVFPSRRLNPVGVMNKLRFMQAAHNITGGLPGDSHPYRQRISATRPGFFQHGQKLLAHRGDFG